MRQLTSLDTHADVKVKVKARVVDRVGVVQAEWDLRQPPAQRGQRRQAPGDQVLDV